MSEDNTTATQDNTVAAEETVTTETTTETTQQTEQTAEQITEAAETTPAENETPETPPGAPEEYAEFTVPEGFTAPIDDFKAWAKEQNITQEVAQSAVDFYINKVVPIQQAAQEKQVKAWTKESEKKYGQEGITAANKALGRFITPKFKSFLTETGLGNHPEMVGVFKSIGEQIKESGLVDTQTRPSNGPTHYPGLPQNNKRR